MKANLIFRDQVNTLGSWFENWSECERTVALYSICSRLGAPQARLLVRVLEHSLADSTELPRLEQEANDSGKFTSDECKFITLVRMFMFVLFCWWRANRT